MSESDVVVVSSSDDEENYSSDDERLRYRAVCFPQGEPRDVTPSDPYVYIAEYMRNFVHGQSFTSVSKCMTWIRCQYCRTFTNRNEIDQRWAVLDLFEDETVAAGSRNDLWTTE
jgi:hypothetical protein